MRDYHSKCKTKLSMDVFQEVAGTVIFTRGISALGIMNC